MALENLFGITETDKILAKLNEFVSASGMADIEILTNEIFVFLNSEERKNIIKSYEYYKNKTDIQDKKRMIGTRELQNRSNVKRQHPMYRKFVNQKVGYLLSKQPSITTENEEYQDYLDEIFDSTFRQQLSKIGKNVILGGETFLYVYFDQSGKIKFKVFDSHTFKAFYGDDERTEIISGVRIYKTIEYINKQREVVTKVEEYTQQGINYFELEGNTLIPDVFVNNGHQNYLTIGDQEYNWPVTPIVPFRYNEEAQPLLDFVKDGIDIYNRIASSNADLIIDLPLLVLILKGYGGANVEEFVNDLNSALAIKMDSDGGVDTLDSAPNIDAVEKTLERIRSELYEAASAVDMQQAGLGNDSGEKVKMRYADLDVDCNLLEENIQQSFQKLVELVNMALKVTTGKDFSGESVTLTLNRDIIINEKDSIEMARSSVGILDDKTIRENHPWYIPEVEDRLAEENEPPDEDAFNQTFKKVLEDGQEED